VIQLIFMAGCRIVTCRDIADTQRGTGDRQSLAAERN
jgi:hypothetical protein